MDAEVTSQVEQDGQVEVEAVTELAGQADVAALDATLREADWPVAERGHQREHLPPPAPAPAVPWG